MHERRLDDSNLYADSGSQVREIRPMILRDIPAVLQIEQEAFSSPWTEEDIRSVLRRNGGIGKVAVDNAGKILGFIIYEVRGNSARIWDIAVPERAQRSGIGELLVREGRSQLRIAEKAFGRFCPTNLTASLRNTIRHLATSH